MVKVVVVTDHRFAGLGVGTWQWGDRFLWGYGRGYTDRDLREVFEVSVASGVTLFDTAEVYGQGRAERLLGTFIKESRASVRVATKCFPFPWRVGKWALHRALRRSLARLKLPVVDVYMMHWPFPPMAVETWMDAMTEAVHAGLVRAVGVSNYSAEQMRRAHAALARHGLPLVCNQVKFNLLERQVQQSGLLQACRDLDVTVIAYSPLAQGVLTGKYGPTQPLPGIRGRWRNATFLARAEPVLNVVRRIALARAKTMGQVALSWIMANGAVPIPGAKNARQARENAGALGWVLTPDEVRALHEAGLSA